jgi:histidinol-phosphate/aromatic aminotransferase/cobyric acid decarboxylase-like protein
MNYFKDKEIRQLILINPDNPSGNLIPYTGLLELMEWTQSKGIRLLVDESFVDFSEDGQMKNSLLQNPLLEENPGLVVIKSISKSYGVPGIRLGILASGDRSFIEKIKKEVAIWNINSFGEYFLQIFSKYESDYRHACQLFVRERDRFQKDLNQIPFIRVIPSHANYFLVEVKPPYRAGKITTELLNQHHLLVKDASSKTAFRKKEYLRIAVRNEKDNRFLTDQLKNLKP